MYCSYCGKENPEGTLYCAHCGNRIAENSNDRRGAQKSKATMRLVLLILAGVLFVSSIISGVSFFSKPVYKEQIDTISIASNNLQNGGYATSDNEYYYFFRDSNYVKAPVGMPTETEIVADTNSVFQIDYNWTYYYCGSLFFADTDSIRCVDESGKVETIERREMFQSFFAEHPRTYYLGDSSSPTSSLKYNGSKITELPANRLYRYGVNLYVFSDKVPNGLDNPKTGLWRLNLDGSNPEQLLDYCPEYFVVWDDQAFFTNGEKLYVSDLDCKNIKQLDGISVSYGVNVDDEYIYYINSEDGALYRANKDGSGRKIIVMEQCSSIILLDDWIFYLQHEGPNRHLCMVKKDGSDNNVVVPNWK